MQVICLGLSGSHVPILVTLAVTWHNQDHTNSGLEHGGKPVAAVVS